VSPLQDELWLHDDVMLRYLIAFDVRIYKGAVKRYYKLRTPELSRLNYMTKVSHAHGGKVHLYKLTEVQAMARGVYLKSQPQVTLARLEAAASTLGLTCITCDTSDKLRRAEALRSLIIEHLCTRGK